MPDPISLEDQVKALTAQVKKLAGDLNIRFEQLSLRIDQQNTSFATLNQALSDLANQSVAHRVSRPFAPALDGDWVGGTTSGNTPLIPIPVPVAQNVLLLQQLIINGSMPVALPNLSRIEVFRASFDFKVSPPGPHGQLQGGLSIRLQRMGLNAKNSETVVELGGGPGSTDSQGGPILGRELVDNDLFKYSIFSTLSLTTTQPLPPGFPVPVPQGLVVLKSFQVDCIVG
jgi:hypothetical protein